MLLYLPEASGNTVDSGMGHRVGLHLRITFKKGLESIRDAGVLLSLIALCVLFRVPEADRELSLPSIFGLQSNQVHKSRLFLKDGQDLVAQFVLKLLLSFRFHVAFHNACKHRENSFRIFLGNDVIPARRHGGSKISLRGGEVGMV